MHGDEEHALSESRVALGIRQVPNLPANIFSHLRLDKHSLHLFGRELATLILIKHGEHLTVQFLLILAHEPY